MDETFVCGHGRTVEIESKGLPECAADVATLAVPEDGEERERVLRALVEGPLCVPFSLIHEKTEAPGPEGPEPASGTRYGPDDTPGVSR